MALRRKCSHEIRKCQDNNRNRTAVCNNTQRERLHRENVQQRLKATPDGEASGIRKELRQVPGFRCETRNRDSCLRIRYRLCWQNKKGLPPGTSPNPLPLRLQMAFNPHQWIELKDLSCLLNFSLEELHTFGFRRGVNTWLAIIWAPLHWSCSQIFSKVPLERR